MTSVLENQEQSWKFHVTAGIDTPDGKAKKLRKLLIYTRKQYETNLDRENIRPISGILTDTG